MIENNLQQPLDSAPRRIDFKTEMEFDLARIDYWCKTKSEDHPLRNMVKLMESSLLGKMGMSITE